MSLRFTIPGMPVSGNHARKTVGVMRYNAKKGEMAPAALTYVTEKASTYRARVKAIAWVAMKQQGWTPPDCAVVDIEYFNIRLDRENCMKETNDAIAASGVLACSDYWILDGRTAHFWDDGPQRVEVTITKANRRDYDRRSKKRKTA